MDEKKKSTLRNMGKTALLEICAASERASAVFGKIAFYLWDYVLISDDRAAQEAQNELLCADLGFPVEGRRKDQRWKTVTDYMSLVRKVKRYGFPANDIVAMSQSEVKTKGNALEKAAREAEAAEKGTGPQKEVVASVTDLYLKSLWDGRVPREDAERAKNEIEQYLIQMANPEVSAETEVDLKDEIAA